MGVMSASTTTVPTVAPREIPDSFERYSGNLSFTAINNVIILDLTRSRSGTELLRTVAVINRRGHRRLDWAELRPKEHLDLHRTRSVPTIKVCAIDDDQLVRSTQVRAA